MSTGLPDVPDSHGVLEHLPFTPNITLGLGHHLPPFLGLQSVQRGPQCLHLRRWIPMGGYEVNRGGRGTATESKIATGRAEGRPCRNVG